MSRVFLFIVMVLAVAACRRGREHVVVMRGMTFEPAELTIAGGDRVVWRNEDIVAHTATGAGRFDSGAVDPGKSFTVTLRQAGELAYGCTLHPVMKGKITVR